MYEAIGRTGQMVLNFPSSDIYARCQETISNNGYEDDEITKSGLTAEKSTFVNAPRIKECFLNLECEYMWEKEITLGSKNVLMCVKVLNICMDSDYYDKSKKSRFGESGLLYNVHAPLNPENGEQEPDSIATLHILDK